MIGRLAMRHVPRACTMLTAQPWRLVAVPLRVTRLSPTKSSPKTPPTWSTKSAIGHRPCCGAVLLGVRRQFESAKRLASWISAKLSESKPHWYRGCDLPRKGIFMKVGEFARRARAARIAGNIAVRRNRKSKSSLALVVRPGPRVEKWARPILTLFQAESEHRDPLNCKKSH
jgi:hypothetical protein